MKWNNANVDNLPSHGQEVLICVDGVYYIAVYDTPNNSFMLNNRSRQVYNPKEVLIYWVGTD
jgi:hypothetical protein